MEATANYVYNVNLPNTTFSEVIDYPLTIDVGVNALNQVQMIGTSMTSAFNKLLDDIEQDAIDLGKVPALVDVVIETVTDTEVTVRAAVAYVEDLVEANPVTDIDWFQGAIQISQNVNADLMEAQTNSGCFPWVADAVIYMWSAGNPLIQCTTSGGNCLTSVVGTSTTLYDDTNIPTDVANSKIIGEEYIQIENQNNQPPFGGQNYPYSLTGMLLGSGNSSVQGSSEVTHYLFVSSILGGSQYFCY